MQSLFRRSVCFVAAIVLSLALAATALAAGTGQNGFAASDYVTGLAGSGAGPIGLAFNSAGDLYVADYGGSGDIYVFPPGGGSTPSATFTEYGLFGLAFGAGGHLYATDFSGGARVVEIDPATGAVMRTVAPAPSGGFYGIAVDPISGDLFVSTVGSNPVGIYRISNYSAGPGTVTPYTGNVGSIDGISFGPDGTLYAAANDNSIEQIAGTNAVSPGSLLATASFPGGVGPDGVAVAADNSFVVSNNNNGTMTKIVFSGTSATLTTIVTGGTRGDFATVGSDGCLYATQSTSITKVTAANGTCPFLPVTPNMPPTANAGGPYSGAEGSVIAVSGTASDLDGDTVTTQWTASPNAGTDGSCAFADPTALSTTVSCTDQGSYTLTLSANDGVNPPVTSTAQLTVGNAAIAVGPVSASNTAAIGSTFTASAPFTDPGTADAHTASWDWGDGSATTAGLVTETVGSGSGSVAGSHTYTAPGVYTVTVSVSDQDTPPGTGSATFQVVVYQPTQFVIWGGNNPDLSQAITTGTDYPFWGAQWANQVAAGDFSANASFKGYADTVSGSSWTTSPGNSSTPPASVASYISVIVSTHITKSGSTIGGNVAEIVVLKVDNPGAYAPNPGHPGSGVMVAIVH